MISLPTVLDRKTYLIGGKVLDWTGPCAEVLSPMTQDQLEYGHAVSASDLAGAGIAGVPDPARIVLGRSPLLTEAEALKALEAARRAFSSGMGEWPSKSFSERVRAVELFISGIDRKKARIVETVMWEIAKPRREVEDEFDRTINFLRRIISDGAVLGRRTGRMRRDKGIFGRVAREPLGVALCLGPYNYPIFETLSLVIPALLAGNTVIMKPPRFGVLFFHDMIEDFAGCFPAGAANILFGDGERIVKPLMSSGGVDVLAFIGSAATANNLLSLHPGKNRLRSLLGLGAKNAAVVLDDADLETAVRECLTGGLAFNGQRCAAIKIIFVQGRIAGRFLESIKEALGKVSIGMPWIDGVRITPLADPERIPFLRQLVDDALDRGAEILNEGGGLAYGTILAPALVFPVNPEMRLYHEEQFGPIIPVAPFQEISQVILYVQQASYGQQASVFGRNRAITDYFIKSVRTSVARVNVNSKCQRGPDVFPFTGRKESAKGDFSSPAVLEFFSETFSVTRREREK